MTAAFLLRAMQPADLPAMIEIEEALFVSDAWPLSFYERDLHNPHARYFVLEAAANHEVVGYACYWILDDEANLGNLAVAQRWQRQGLGEYLLRHAMRALRAQGAVRFTLEVRVSNTTAQALYRKLGFAVDGRRRRYYQDNGEDALLMSMDVT